MPILIKLRSYCYSSVQHGTSNNGSRTHGYHTTLLTEFSRIKICRACPNAHDCAAKVGGHIIPVKYIIILYCIDYGFYGGQVFAHEAQPRPMCVVRSHASVPTSSAMLWGSSSAFPLSHCWRGTNVLLVGLRTSLDTLLMLSPFDLLARSSPLWIDPPANLQTSSEVCHIQLNLDS